jgi:hypothetical protein
VPSAQEDRDPAAGSLPAAGGVRGVRSGVDSAAAVVAGAAAAGVGAALRVRRVVVKLRAAVDRANGWGVIWRVVNPAARRRHVRQIMVVWVWCCTGLLRVAGVGWMRDGIGAKLKISMESGMGHARSFDIKRRASPPQPTTEK